jgi:hypothetical protein
MAGRHAWGKAVRFPLKTERQCSLCGCVRVTRHDAGPSAIPWTEFWLHGDQMPDAGRTPTCHAVRRAKRA